MQKHLNPNDIVAEYLESSKGPFLTAAICIKNQKSLF